MSAGEKTREHELTSLVRRLTALSSSETSELRKDPAASLARFVEAKNRCLYEINLVLMDRNPISPSRDLLREFANLREALEENARILEACKGATQEIVKLIAAQQEKATTDGTYSSRSMRTAGAT